jgi:hypothetical protein
MINVQRAGFLVVLSALAACASRPTSIPILATPMQVSALAGVWDGRYDTDEYGGRDGFIHFELTAGRDSANGYVIMMYRAPRDRVSRGGRIDAAPPMIETEQLTVKFVLAEGHEVVGELDPYTDPRCGCRLETTFRGELRGNEIKGTFVTRHLDSGSTVRGTWAATRQQGR